MLPTLSSCRSSFVLSSMLLVAGCGTGNPEGSGPIALIDAFSADDLEGRFEPEPVEPTLWAAEDASSPLQVSSFALAGDVSEGLWRGTLRAPTGVLVFEADEALGAGDQLFALEVRMRVSAGESLEFTTLGSEGPPSPAFAAPEGPPLAYATPIVAGEEMKTYRVEMSRAFGVGPGTTRDVTRLILRPSNGGAGTETEIESVRLIFRREHMGSLASGVGWHGLGEVWSETLITRAGEVARFAVDVPQDAWLDLTVGTIENQPVRFEVDVAAAGGEPVALVRRTVTTPERWESEPTDLGAFAGRSVEIVLRAASPTEGSLAFWGHPTVRQRHTGAAAPDATVPQGVILVIGDTLRRDHMSLYGYERETTPEIARLAAEGVRFDNAVAQGTWTKISVSSILTSLHPTSHGLTQLADRLPAGVTTMAEMFRQAGYATLQTSSVPFSGQLTNLQQGVEVLHEAASIDEEAGSKTGRPLGDRVLDWIETHRDVPFFAVLHAMDAHSPYEPAAPYNDWWTEPGAAQQHKADEEQVQPLIENPIFRQFIMPTSEELAASGVDAERYLARENGWYDGSIRGLDAEVGRLADRLEHLGLRDRVVVIFLADHGEELLEHGQHWHGLTVYGEQTDVPLVVWAPGFLPGGVVATETVQLLDVFPTLADLAGLSAPESAQGQSLVPLIRRLTGSGEEGGHWQQRPAISETHMIRPDSTTTIEGLPESQYAIAEGRWKLIESVSPPEGWPRFMLFDREADPLDQNDLSNDNPEIVDELAEKLAAWRQWALDRKLEPDAVEDMSAEELSRLRSLGYI